MIPQPSTDTTAGCPHRGKFIAYFRVSTDKQGKSGLGLEAQREAVLSYLNGVEHTTGDLMVPKTFSHSTGGLG